MDFSNIPASSFVGRILRAPLGLLPPETRIRILSGPLRGKRWVVGSSIHGCWLGTYEYEKQKFFAKSITRNSTIFDVGANVGFYSLLASELTGGQGRVFAFEPLPRNLVYLRTHLRINNLTNVTVIEAAVSNVNGTASFEESLRGETAHLSVDGQVTVRSVSLDRLFEQGEIPDPDFIKMDVEGAEFDALQGARSLLERARPTIFLATHTSAIHRECGSFLKNLGYELSFLGNVDPQDSREIVATPARVGP